jgi:hypothetical protein
MKMGCASRSHPRPVLSDGAFGNLKILFHRLRIEKATGDVDDEYDGVGVILYVC